MKTWMLPWLFPVGLLATVVFVTVSPGPYAAFAAVSPVRCSSPFCGAFTFLADDDADTKYWRFGRR